MCICLLSFQTKPVYRDFQTIKQEEIKVDDPFKQNLDYNNNSSSKYNNSSSSNARAAYYQKDLPPRFQKQQQQAKMKEEANTLAAYLGVTLWDVS